MPTLRIMSIYREQKRKFAAELIQARTEREQFTTTLVARFGKELTDAMRRKAWRTEDMIPGSGEMFQLSQEISVAAKKLQTLDHLVVAARKKIRTSDCWFREMPGPTSVLEMAGLSWRLVNEKCSNGRLPVSGALWLLGSLHTANLILPTEEQSGKRAETRLGLFRLPEKWRRRLLRRRWRLTLLLRTAVIREEDIRWQFRL